LKNYCYNFKVYFDAKIAIAMLVIATRSAPAVEFL